MLDKLKNLQIERLDLYEAIALHMLAEQFAAHCVKLEVPVPEYVENSTRILREEIKARSRDALEARLREVRSRRATLKTREEQRAELEAEEARLSAALGKGGV